MLTLFAACYTQVPAGLGGLFWQRVALPGPGPAGAQDAYTLAALDYLQDVYNQLQRDASRKG